MNILQANLNFKSNVAYGNKVEKLILHHAGANCTVEDINNWHQSNGWAGCGYHYFVRKNGTVYQARPDSMVGCHAGDANYNSLGICFEGNFETEVMELIQFNAGKELIAMLLKKYNLSKDKVFRHKDFMSTDCPGVNFPFTEMVNGANLNINVNKGECKLLSNCRSNPIWYGCKGVYVTLLQSSLKILGYYKDSIDGSFGYNTKKAVMDYQRANGLSVDGSCGPATWKSLLG